MSINPKNHVSPHKHSLKDIVDGTVGNVNIRTTTQIPNIYDYLTINKKMIFKDPDGSGYWIDLYLRMVTDPLFPDIQNPILYTTQGLWVQKDIFANGALMTASPTGGTGGGCLQIAGGFEHVNDPPRINLTSTQDYIAITKGSTIHDENGNPSEWNLDRVLANLKCKDVITSYGHIGNLTVPQVINVDSIYGLTNVDLTIKPYTGKKIKLDGDVQVTGTISSATNNIQKGTASTGTDGTATINFSPSFNSTPVIVCTPIDSSGRHVSIVITSMSQNGFTVQATTINSHNHTAVGETGVAGKHTHSAVGTTGIAGKHTHYAVGETGIAGGHDHYAVGETGIAVRHSHYAVGETGVAGKHTHSAVGTTGTTSHNHVIQMTSSSQNTGPASAGTAHTHSYTDYYPTGNTLNETSHAHSYATTTSEVEEHAHTYATTTSEVEDHSHTYATTTSEVEDHKHTYAGYTGDTNPVSAVQVSFNWIAL